MNTQIAEKAHATYSASGSDRWLNCPGSIALTEDAPPQRESDYAAEGTKAHAYLEMILKAYLTPKGKPRSLLLELHRSNPADVEMIEHAWAAAKWIIERTEETKGTLHAETKVDATPFTKEGQFGTADALIVELFGTLYVVDFKYGAGVPVDVVENTQMLYYALGASHQHDHNFTEVVMVIIQPRADHADGPIRSWTLSIDELLEWEGKFKDGVEACEKPDAELRSGDWCRWCPAKTICPEVSTRAMAQAQIDFAPETKELKMPEPKGIAIRYLPEVLNAADKIEAWIAGVREHAFHVLERGEKIRGWKLVEKRSIRKWIDPVKTAKEAEKLFGKTAFTAPELLSPLQLEKNAISRIRKAAKLEWVAKRVTDKSSGLTLAPDSDKRKAVSPIETDFTVVDETPTKALPISRKTRTSRKGK